MTEKSNEQMTWPLQKVCTLTTQLLASDENWCLRILVCFSWSVEMNSMSEWISDINYQQNIARCGNSSFHPRKKVDEIFSPQKRIRGGNVPQRPWRSSWPRQFYCEWYWCPCKFGLKVWSLTKKVDFQETNFHEGHVMKGDVIMNPGTFRVRQFCQTVGILKDLAKTIGLHNVIRLA